METKTRTPYGVFLLILAVLLVPLLLIKPGYYLYRELEYRHGTPTEAEQLVHAYASHAKIPYGAYPKDLIALLETSPEARNFVLDYPERENMEIDLSAYEKETVPLFLQWDPMWGYEKYGSSYLAVTGCGPTCLAMAGYYLTDDEEKLGQLLLFEGRVRRHHQCYPQPQIFSHPGQTDAGIAGGGLHYPVPRAQQTPVQGIPQHIRRRPVLNRAADAAPLQFRRDAGRFPL